MTRPKGALDTLLDGLGIKVVPIYRRRKPAQSHARATMHEIRNRLGDGHLVLTLRCIRQTKGNRDELWSETIGAVSDVLEQKPQWIDRMGELLDAFDTIPLGTMRRRAVLRRPWPVRQTMRAFLFDALEARMDNACDKDLFGEEAA